MFKAVVTLSAVSNGAIRIAPGQTSTFTRLKNTDGAQPVWWDVIQTAVPVPTPTMTPTAFVPAGAPAKIDVQQMHFYYGPRRVPDNVTLQIRPHEVNIAEASRQYIAHAPSRS